MSRDMSAAARPPRMNRHRTRFGPAGVARRATVAGVLGALLLVVVGGVVLAQNDLGGKLRAGSEVRVPAGETVAGDLYAFAGTVTIDGSVDGDLVASGGMISVGGSVGGDVLAAGGTVRVGGEVAGDVRAAGGQVAVGGSVGEDALVTAGQLEIGADATVGEDVILQAGQATVAGVVQGSITGGAGAYTRTGTVGGTDEVTINQNEAVAPERTVDRVVDGVQHFVAALVIGLIALWLAPRFVAAAESIARRQPLQSAAWGFVAIVGFIVALVVLAIVMVIVAGAVAAVGLDLLAVLAIAFGVVAMIALTLVYAVSVAFLADVIVGLVVAWLANRQLSRPEAAGRVDVQLVASLALGLAVVVLLSSLPVVGPWIKLVIVLLGTGALLSAAWRWWRERRPAEGRRAEVVTGTGPAAAAPPP